MGTKWGDQERLGGEDGASAPPLTIEEIRDRLRPAEGKCGLCGLGHKGKGTLCGKCRPLAGLSVSQWGWCDGRHRRATTQRTEDGIWRCLTCQSKTSK